MTKKPKWIDDNVVATHDPMAVIDPAWWSVIINDIKEKY